MTMTKEEFVKEVGPVAWAYYQRLQTEGRDRAGFQWLSEQLKPVAERMGMRLEDVEDDVEDIVRSGDDETGEGMAATSWDVIWGRSSNPCFIVFRGDEHLLLDDLNEGPMSHVEMMARLEKLGQIEPTADTIYVEFRSHCHDDMGHTTYIKKDGAWVPDRSND